MSQLLVRDVDEEIIAALRRRAAEHGRSAEEEHRLILRELLLSAQPRKRSFKEVLAEMPNVGEDPDFDLR
jgi:antitoxin FitA